MFQHCSSFQFRKKKTSLIPCLFSKFGKCLLNLWTMNLNLSISYPFHSTWRKRLQCAITKTTVAAHFDIAITFSAFFSESKELPTRTHPSGRVFFYQHPLTFNKRGITSGKWQKYWMKEPWISRQEEEQRKSTQPYDATENPQRQDRINKTAYKRIQRVLRNNRQGAKAW
jgi:hypothetical protein